MIIISFFDLKKIVNNIIDIKKIKAGTYDIICNELKILILIIILKI